MGLTMGTATSYQTARTVQNDRTIDGLNGLKPSTKATFAEQGSSELRAIEGILRKSLKAGENIATKLEEMKGAAMIGGTEADIRKTTEVWIILWLMW